MEAVRDFPPLANLFAFGSDNPARLEEIERRLRAAQRYQRVWRPHPGWVAATSSLQGSALDDQEVRDAGFVFAEGRDVMLGNPDERGQRCRELAVALQREPGQLVRWPGDFSFLCFHPDGAVTAVRSCAGLVPLYWWLDKDDVVLATQCDALIRFGGMKEGLDVLGAAIWTMGFPGFAFNRTHLRGVSALMAGEFVTIGGSDRRRPLSTRYWTPMPAIAGRPSPAQAKEHQQRLRSLLMKRLTQDLDPLGANLLTLSGGVDSSALLALVGGALKLPVMTWSLIPPAYAPAQKRELRYIESVRQWAGVKRHWQKEVTTESVEELIARAPEVPFPILHPALCSLGGMAREENIRVMIGGEFADEICGARQSTPDWAEGTSLLQLLTSVGRWPFGLSAPARWLKVRVLNAIGRPYLVHPDRLPESCPVGLQERYQDFLADLRRWISTMPVQHRYMLTRHLTLDLASMNWEACCSLGIRRSIPFLSRETIELTMECHPSELIGPDTKRLLRGALHNDVPHENLYRAEKGDFGLLADGLKPLTGLELEDDRVWGELAEIVSPEWRRATLKRGCIDFGEKYPLLCLKILQKNLKATVGLAR
jgi:asparagine synthetase B (glutamine-hydrolysing)